MKLFKLILATVFILTRLSIAFAEKPAGRIELPLQSGDIETVKKIISPKLMLVITPEEDGWYVEVIKRKSAGPAYNLLYHSIEWHGPYETDVCAWHIAENYYDNSRWLCVKGYPFEVHILLKEPKIEKKGTCMFFKAAR